jgi:hypothetical protein
LGRKKVAAALRAAGAVVELHDDHFRQDTPDETWLPIIAAKGWVLLSKDGGLRRRSAQREILLAVGVCAFILSDSEMSGDDMAAAYVQALRRMTRVFMANPAGFVAGVSPQGVVELLHRSTTRGR